jgi:uncharacterized membrane protein
MIHVVYALWNLLLACVPVVLGLALARGLSRTGSPRWHWLPVALAWLLFVPNTCYLLTEWRHIFARLEYQELFRKAHESQAGLLWLLFLCGCGIVYSGMGILTFVLAVRPLERLARERGVRVGALAAPFFFLVAHGVYLGLVLRFNSWDAVTRPGAVFEAMLGAFTHPVLLGLTAAFAFCLWLAYLGVDIWLDGLLLRLKRVQGSGFRIQQGSGMR